MDKDELRNTASRPVRITIPAKLAYDLGGMQKVTASILGRLGCPACHSGFDLRWDLEDRFHVGQDLAIHDIAGVRLER